MDTTPIMVIPVSPKIHCQIKVRKWRGIAPEHGVPNKQPQLTAKQYQLVQTYIKVFHPPTSQYHAILKSAVNAFTIKKHLRPLLANTRAPKID